MRGSHVKQRIASDIAPCANTHLNILSAHKTTPAVKKHEKSCRGCPLETRAKRLSEKDTTWNSSQEKQKTHSVPGGVSIVAHPPLLLAGVSGCVTINERKLATGKSPYNNSLLPLVSIYDS